MEYLETKAGDIPIQLLLEADPSEQIIYSYLSQAWCFAAKLDDNVVGACIVKGLKQGIAEIVNVAVYPGFQQQGIGSDLLRFVLAELPNKAVYRAELGTGSFGYQLTYYQRICFRVDTVIKDYFLTHYADPIFENGIQHKDMLRLYIDL